MQLDLEPEPIPGQVDLFEVLTVDVRYVPRGPLEEPGAGGWRAVPWDPPSHGPSADATGELYVAERFRSFRPDEGRELLYSIRCRCGLCGDGATWTRAHATRSAAIEEHVDSHWPGWRALPVLERQFDGEGRLVHVLPEDYPSQWQAPGSPVRECRGDVPAGLHVPRVSPFGGWAMAVARPCPEEMHW